MKETQPYGCSRARDRNCKNQYIREEELIKELLKIIDLVDVNELDLRHKRDDEIARFNKFQGHVLRVVGATKITTVDLDVRVYAKYVLREGSVSEKRELLGNLRSGLIYRNKMVSFVDE